MKTTKFNILPDKVEKYLLAVGQNSCSMWLQRFSVPQNRFGVGAQWGAGIPIH